MGRPVYFNSFLILISMLIFVVGFAVFNWGTPGPKFFPEDILLGLAFFAGGHIWTWV